MESPGGGAAANLFLSRTPDAVAHMGIGGIMDSRRAQITDILQVFLDFLIAPGQIQRDLGHVVAAVVSQAVDSSVHGFQNARGARYISPLYDLRVTYAGHNPFNTQLLDELNVLITGFGRELGADFYSRG